MTALDDRRSKCEQTRKKFSYKTVLNTCLSFLNEGNNCYDCNVIKRNRRRVKNLAKNTGVKYVFCGYPIPDSYRSRWSGMAFHSLLQRRFAPRKVVHLPSLRSRMTGMHLIPFRMKSFSVSSHSCPFVNLAVDTFPDNRGKLALFIFPLYISVKWFACFPISGSFLYESFHYFAVLLI